MKVSFGTVKENNSMGSLFKKKENPSPFEKKPTSDEVTIAKTKRVLSECTYVAFGIGILYFAMSRVFRVNDFKNKSIRHMEKCKTPLPEPSEFIETIKANLRNLAR